MKLFAGSLLLCLYGIKALGQQTHDTLKGVEVVGNPVVPTPKDVYEPGIKKTSLIVKPESSNQSIAELLTAGSTAFVRATGLNGAATLSIRGASAAQSAVYWEGVPLMNGATGVADISLLPAGFFSSVTLNYGSSAALWGSGNVGGALQLSDYQPVYGPGAVSGNLEASAGSFGQFSGLVGLKRSGQRSFFSASLAASKARNNFPATDQYGRSYVTTNAAQTSTNAALAVGLKTGKYSEVIARAQYYRYDRQIPRALFEAKSLKDQQDEGLRTLLHWKRQTEPHGKKMEWFAKAAFLLNSFGYSDSTIGLSTAYQVNQLFGEAGWAKAITPKSQAVVFVPMQYFWLQDTIAAHRQSRFAVAGSYTYSFRRLKPSINFRLESFDGTLIVLPGLNARFQVNENTAFTANAQYTYRAPNLNELYFQPGGNTDLKPEKGWHLEISAITGRRWNNAAYNLQVTGYHRSIQDWIIWLGGAIWTPHNLAVVQSQGIEVEHSLTLRYRDVQARFALNGSASKATVSETYAPGDNSVGCQIPYVPIWRMAGAITLNWRQYRLAWSANYTGKRFIVSDESQWLPGFFISNLQLAARFQKRFELSLAANNLFNCSYSVMANRPMPGFNWRATVAVHLNKSEE